MFIDFHTHSLRNKGINDILEIVSLHGNEEKEKSYYTVGHHPWFAKASLTEKEITSLKDRYQKDKYCLAIGEFGLDKLKGPDLNVQIHIVKQQLELAQALQAPVIIHCVRQYDVLTKLKSQYDIPAWIIHGYYRHKALALQLIDKGFYLSCCCHEKAPRSFLEACMDMPVEKMFLETDSYPEVDIKNVYGFTASLKKMDVESLQKQILDNIKTIFTKWDIG